LQVSQYITTREIYLFTDRSSSTGYAISVWDSDKDAVANKQSGYYKEQLNRFVEYFAAPPV
jgi:hypothetical protein